MGQKKLFVINNVKTRYLGDVISDFNGEEIIGTFPKKELQKTNQIKFRVEKVIETIEMDYMGSGNAIANHFIVGLIKMI